MDDRTAQAIESGRRHAAGVLQTRAEELAARRVAIDDLSAGPQRVAPRVDPELAARLGPPAPRGTLIAEGDSWFDFPWFDVLAALEDEHGYSVESVAHRGDRVEEMAYAGGQLAKLVRLLERCLRRGEVPRALLLSGGGNDIVGDDLQMLLEHADSPTAGFNPAVVEGIVDYRLRHSYARILAEITATCEGLLGEPLPIVIHGYDRPVPDGRGFLGGFWILPGPWLEPSFRRKGYLLPTAQRLMGELIDRFNAMLVDLVAESEFAHVRHVDLRGVLSDHPDYREWWSDELHPTRQGFRAVASRLVEAL